MNKLWVEPEIRDSVIKHLSDLNKLTGIKVNLMLRVIAVSNVKYYRWVKRTGCPNRHNGKIPKGHWLTPEEVELIENYAREHYSVNDFYIRDGYRRISYQMLDEDIVAASPSSVYRVLSRSDLLNKWNTSKQNLKGTGFRQPDYPHKHWHTDIKYLNYNGSFLFLITVIDGYSRYVLHHQVRHSMTTYDVQLVIQQTKDKYPLARPRLITDNGSQYCSKDFQSFIKEAELRHTKTSIAYPESNGKIERWHRTISEECLRIKHPQTFEEYQIYIEDYVNFYNTKRLHASISYLTPEDYLLGRKQEKLKVREQKLESAEKKREGYWQLKNLAA